MTFYQSVGLADIPALIDWIKTNAEAEGNTVLDWNTGTPAIGATNGNLGRGIVITWAGSSAQAAIHKTAIEFSRFNSILGFNGHSWEGEKQATISTISQSTTTVTVNTTSAHGFTTGDLVLINGTDTAALNSVAGGTEAAPSTITVVDSDTFTFTSPISQTASGAGGTAIAVYNWVGSRNSAATTTLTRPANSTMNAYTWVDTFRIAGIVSQGGVFYPFYFGQVARSRTVQSDGAMCALSTASVGPGGTNVVMTIDRSPTGLYSGQKITLVAPNSAVPNSLSQSRTALHTTTLSAVGPGNQVTIASLPASTFPIGTLIGWNPNPCAIMAAPITATASLNSRSWYLPHSTSQLTTSSPIGVVYATNIEVPSNTMTEGDIDPNADSVYGQFDLTLFRSGDGIQGPLVGMSCFPIGTQTDLDIMRTRAPSFAPSGDWKIFISQVQNDVTDAYGVAIGDGAS